MSATVLLVDDEAGVRVLARLMLEADGFAVLEAGSGEEALAVAGRHDGPIALLVTDVMMPDMNGLELAQRLVRERAETNILFISGRVHEVDVSPHTLRRRTAFLRKPFRMVDLCEVARRLAAPPRPPGAPADA
jgi:CheY-like chemotaxis protein